VKKNGLLGAINPFDLAQAERNLQYRSVEQFGMIKEMTVGKPHFIH
jgi:hypothetical protein